MASRVTWDGLNELRAALRALPETLAGEASGIVVGEATAAARDIASAYPTRTGNLAGHVRVVTMDAGRFGAGAKVANTAKHAYIFENGTQARHTATGANRGAMPPGHVFIPRAIQHRRAMYDQLKGLLERHGLSASGDA